MSTGFMWMLIVCGTIQAAMLAILIVYLWFVFATRRWLQTTGTVITSRVVSRTTNEHGANNSDLTNTPLVEYEYQVNDQKFRSDRIRIGGGKSEVELEYVLGRYPLGAKVVVYYNPADPQQAVLERGVPAHALGLRQPFRFFFRLAVRRELGLQPLRRLGHRCLGRCPIFVLLR